MSQPGSGAYRSYDAIWRIESARVIAALARRTGDVGLAEDLAHDAFVSALEQWPVSGVPDNPGAWLVTVGKRRWYDMLRRKGTLERKQADLTRQAEMRKQLTGADFDDVDEEVGDDRLRLIFIACHPVLPREARVALTLRLVAGLTTDEIARAYLVREATVAQRVVRAKRSLSEARVPFELPPANQLQERLDAVLEVIYLVFNEGYAATAGEQWARPELCLEALRLGRIVAQLLPAEPEVHGLVALMELQASRLHARLGPQGEPVLLADQDRSRWDPLLVRRGLEALERASELANLAANGRGLGPYGLQAAIAACHARAATLAATDWARICALYEALAQVAPSPVVELNRAVALSMAYGPEAGLEVVDSLVPDPLLARYYLLPSVRGDLLAKLGRFDEARADLERAASLTRNEREQQLLLARAARMPPAGAPLS
ncbi:MAG TPA: RNA polymerase sigma factor [Acidimicrobiales bacterium]|nr:RNA polymerase sigma factor [Acidimicrobiales bacterium]